MRQTIEVAEHDRPAIIVGQPIQLIPDDLAEVDCSIRRAVGCSLASHLGQGLLGLPALGGTTSRPHGDPASDTPEPTFERVRVADVWCTAGQHQEGRLENVLGFVRIIEYPATNPIHGRSVT